MKLNIEKVKLSMARNVMTVGDLATPVFYW